MFVGGILFLDKRVGKRIVQWVIKRIIEGVIRRFRRSGIRFTGVDHEVQRNGTPQLRIHQFHAPVNFRRAFEMIDEPVFNLQLRDPHSTQRSHQHRGRHDRLGVLAREAGHRHGKQKQSRDVRARNVLLRLEQHQHRREIEEVQYECQGNANGHHPPEIDHGPDVTDDQGAERHDRRNGRIKTGFRHFLYRVQDQRFLVRLRSLLPQNPIAHNEVDG